MSNPNSQKWNRIKQNLELQQFWPVSVSLQSDNNLPLRPSLEVGECVWRWREHSSANLIYYFSTIIRVQTSHLSMPPKKNEERPRRENTKTKWPSEHISKHSSTSSVTTPPSPPKPNQESRSSKRCPSSRRRRANIQYTSSSPKSKSYRHLSYK